MKKIILITLCVAVPMVAFAKKPKKAVEEPVVEQPAVPELTDEECLEKLSLAHEAVKNEQFEEAYENWEPLYEARPDFNKAIYTDGGKILEYKCAQATSPEEKSQWIARIMKLFDDRIQYMDDPKYPDMYVLGIKALSYLEYYPEDELALPAYDWLKQSVAAMGAKSQIVVLRKLVEVSYNIYKSNPDQYSDQFLKDYQQCAAFLDEIVAAAGKNAPEAQNQKTYIDRLYAASGAADCTQMDIINGPLVRNNTSDLEKLNAVMKLYRRLGCTESDVYFLAAESSHKLKPTDESAAGCAKMCLKKDDADGAIKYYEQAINLATENEDKVDYLYNIARVYYANLQNYPKGAEYAYKALDLDPEDGRCYIVIGLCYAGAKIYDDPILKRSVYWVACDMFRKAKQKDASCASDANKLIATYSQYFPSKEDIFFHKELNINDSFHVGGWINKTTTCTPKAE